ncbi:unnamed protein product [[Candida] boidinii]|nr:unnamed protein product [[Candida] boidinii]
MVDDLLDTTWNNINPSILIILGDEKNSSLTTLMYSKTYTDVYNYCTTASARKPPNLQEREGNGTVRLLGGELYYKLQNYLKIYLEDLNPKNGETFLEFYIRTWERYLIGSTRLNDVLDYINRYWVSKERADGHREIYDILSLCLLSWRDYKFHTNLVILMDEIMSQIRNQRLNKIRSIGNLNIAIKSFVLLGFDANDLKKQNLSVYINDFERRFLIETLNFYTEESNNFIEEYGVVNYLIKAEQRIDEELKRLEELNDHTRRPLNDVLNEVLITNHANTIRSELTNLLDQNRYQDIKRMHQLLKRVPMTIEPLLADFQKYVESQGLNAIKELKESFEKQQQQQHQQQQHSTDNNGSTTVIKKKNPNHSNEIDAKLYIKTLLKVYNKFQEVVKESFDNNEAFVKALDNASQKFINNNLIATPNPKIRQSKTPEILAKYSDDLLKKKDEDMSVDELMTIFKFIEDKDSFETWFRRFLSKRLMLSNMSQYEEEQEEFLIQKLNDANSIEYTHKISNMFTDIRISNDLGSYYRETLLKEKEINNKNNNNNSGITTNGSQVKYINDFEPRILDSSSWTGLFKSNNESFILPKELIGTLDKFEDIYDSKHSGRKLNWIWNRSRCEVKANIAKPGKPSFSFKLTLFQLGLLLPFNDEETLTTSKLIEITALNPEVLKNNLIPIVKSRVLTQNPPGEEYMLKSNTTYTITKNYNSKKMKMNLSLGVKNVESKQEDLETSKEVERRHHEALKACIVRVMKARRNLKHQQLISEVIQQLVSRFHPSINEIKNAIEVLIDESYLVRDPEGSGYEYLA